MRMDEGGEDTGIMKQGTLRCEHKHLPSILSKPKTISSRLPVISGTFKLVMVAS
jgi:hypothetical protein